MTATKRLTYCSSARATKMGGYKTFSEMEKIVNENPVCPLAGIISTRQWLTHKELSSLS